MKIEYVISVLISIFMLICIVVCIKFDMNALLETNLNSLKGKGTSDEPYIIDSLDGYKLFADAFDDPTSKYMNSYISLETDIDLRDGHEFLLLGNLEKDNFFYGTFDGNGHTISGAVDISGDYCGVFPKLGGTVKNLRVESCSFFSLHSGDITGYLSSTGKIINCYAEDKLVGENDNGTIINCVSADEDDEAAYSVWQSAKDLNDALGSIYPIGKLCAWEDTELGVRLTEKVYPTAVKCCTKANLGNGKQNLQAFYSEYDKAWCFVLPYSELKSKRTLDVLKSDGETEKFDLTDKLNEVISDGFTMYKGEIALSNGTPYQIEYMFTENLQTLSLGLYIQNLEYINKSQYRESVAKLHVLDKYGKRETTIDDVTFSGRGNDSFIFGAKKGYSLEFDLPVKICGIDTDKGFGLIPGYRDDSLVTYMFTRDLYKELEIKYAPDYALVNLYVDDEYLGVYFLTEKMSISKETFDIHDLYKSTKTVNKRSLNSFRKVEEGGTGRNAKRVYYDLRREPADVSGGYLLEVKVDDFKDYESRFLTDRDVMYTIKNDSFLGKKQMDYISGYMQEVEDAVCSKDGYNDKGIYYADYLDLESLAGELILYELFMDSDVGNSVYLYKDSDETGDGKIYGTYPWDVEHDLVHEKKTQRSFILGKKEACDILWNGLYQHDDFKEVLRKEWTERFLPAFDENGLLNDEARSVIDSYRDSYNCDLYYNELHWGKNSYLTKCDKIEKIFLKRVEYLKTLFE